MVSAGLGGFWPIWAANEKSLQLGDTGAWELGIYLTIRATLKQEKLNEVLTKASNLGILEVSMNTSGLKQNWNILKHHLEFLNENPVYTMDFPWMFIPWMLLPMVPASGNRRQLHRLSISMRKAGRTGRAGSTAVGSSEAPKGCT